MHALQIRTVAPKTLRAARLTYCVTCSPTDLLFATSATSLLNESVVECDRLDQAPTQSVRMRRAATITTRTNG